jgi:hypothetical protein
MAWANVTPPPPPTTLSTCQSVNCLQVDPRELNLGLIDEASSFSHTLSITNAGPEPVKILRGHSSCDCVQVDKLEGKVIEPGNSIPIALRLAVQAPRQAELTVVHSFRTNTAVEYKTQADAHRTVVWTLEASVRPSIRMSSNVIDFGTVSHYSEGVEQAIMLHTAKDINEVKCGTGASWSVQVGPAEGTFVKQRRLLLRRSGPLALGEIKEEVTVTPVRAGQRLPARKVSLRGRVVEDVQASEPSVHFGRRAVGGCGQETVMLSSMTGRPFRVVAARSNSPALVIHPWPMQSGQAFILKVRFTMPGDIEVTALFEIEDHGGRRYTISLPVRYLGT